MSVSAQAPPGFRAAPRAVHAVTAIRLQSLTPSRLRRCALTLASRGSAQGPSPPRDAWRPFKREPNRLTPDRPGQRPAVIGLGRRIRRGLLRQVVRMCAALDAGGSRLSHHEGWFTDTPPGLAMGLPRHASRPTPQGAAGAFSSVVGALTWPASGSAPGKPSCEDARRPHLPSERFGPRRPCLVVNPGGGAAAPRASWLQPYGENNFPSAAQIPRGAKLLPPPGAPLRCARKRCSQPVPRRSDHNKDAMGANLVQP